MKLNCHYRVISVKLNMLSDCNNIQQSHRLFSNSEELMKHTQWGQQLIIEDVLLRQDINVFAFVKPPVMTIITSLDYCSRHVWHIFTVDIIYYLNNEYSFASSVPNHTLTGRHAHYIRGLLILFESCQHRFNRQWILPNINDICLHYNYKQLSSCMRFFNESLNLQLLLDDYISISKCIWSFKFISH